MRRLLRMPAILVGVGSLPDFFILGAQKAATTSVYDYITRHARNFAPPVKKET